MVMLTVPSIEWPLVEEYGTMKEAVPEAGPAVTV